MPTPTELSLTSLLPTTSPLPQPLLDLAASLLAQSKSRAASLKAEEEIGRTYAVCHIACERLGKKLSLEIGKPAPPCPPKVYGKLKTYLGTVLRTPARKKAEKSTKDDADARTEAKTTPTRRVSSRTATPKRAAGPSGAARHEPSKDGSIDAQIVKTLCDLFDAADVAPHVFAAKEQIRKHCEEQHQANGRPRKKRKTSYQDMTRSIADHDMSREKNVALIVALFLAVLARMDEEMLDLKGQLQRKESAVKEAMAYCKANPKDAADVDEKVLSSDVADLQLQIRDEWMELPWFAAIPSENTIRDDDDDAQERADQDNKDGEATVTPNKRPSKTPLRRKEKHAKQPLDDVAEDAGPAGLLPGLGTMFQSAIDWLSDERRAEYKAWEKGIWKEIRKFEASAA